MIRLLDLAGKAHHRILLLQGPVGPFFWNLAKDLRQAGAEVFKINFNGGDLLFYPRGAVNFRGSFDEWPDFFERFLNQNQLDLVLLFGDCRPIHREAHRIATRCGIEVGVFEEGYVRPDYVTLERCGVNGHSPLFNQQLALEEMDVPDLAEPIQVPMPFFHAMVWAMLYNSAGTVLMPFFSKYHHHRRLDIFDGICWLRSFWRKKIYFFQERGIQNRLQDELSGKYYLVPLQVCNDAQIKDHSCYKNIEEFIQETIASFAQHAPSQTWLVIKHHPLDRGYNNYAKIIYGIAKKFDAAHRILYIHDQHLPTLLNHAKGVVLINSTVGFSALFHEKPVKVMGEAFYNFPLITYPGDLDQFWSKAEPPNMLFYLKFRNFLIQMTQVNGNFYRRLPVPSFQSGLNWS